MARVCLHSLMQTREKILENSKVYFKLEPQVQMIRNKCVYSVDSLMHNDNEDNDNEEIHIKVAI